MDSAELKALVRQLHHLTKALQQNWSAPEPDLPLPETFSGSQGTFNHFIFDCELLFSLKPRTYSQDLVKVRTAMFLLTGRVKTWAHELVRANSVSLLTWSSFVKSLDSWVRHSRLHGEVTPRKATSLPRRTRETILRPVPGGSSEAADITSTRARSRRNVRPTRIPNLPVPPLSETSPSTVASLVPTLNNANDHLYLQPEEADEGSPAMSIDEDDNAHGEPMEICQLRVESPLEVLARRRRRLGLCFYCGDRGHFISYCPVRPVRSVSIGLVNVGPIRSPQLLRDNLEGPNFNQRAGPTLDRESASGMDETIPQIVPVGLRNQGPHEDDKHHHDPRVFLDPDARTDPYSATPEALPGTPEKSAHMVEPEGLDSVVGSLQSQVSNLDQRLMETNRVLQDLATIVPSLFPVPEEDVLGLDPSGSMDTGDGTDPDACPRVPGAAEVAFESAQAISGRYLKALVASHAKVLEPGCVLDYAPGLPDLRTPGLFDDDPYTEEDPCPLSYASDGALVRTVDLGVYEKGLKRELRICAKKGKKNKKKG